MNFSRRTNWNLTEHELAAAVRTRRAAGEELLDLTVSNPTHCGFFYDEPALSAPLTAADALRYEPDPLGMLSARRAVAQYYRDHGAVVEPEQICLTTSTSEAYSFLFRLLCDPGDEVLVARPSYPLFAYLADLDDVALVEYPLLYDAAGGYGWSIDLYALESAIGPRTRAVVLVHPNNPTGNLASASERAALKQLCAERGIALIVDEVFLDYPIDAVKPESFAMQQRDEADCLTFVLSGISKVCALPQMKASWIAACGPDVLIKTATERLEVIADTFLSMNAPIQKALPAWLAARSLIQAQIIARMKQNLEVLDGFLAGTSAQRMAMQGGWTVVVQVARTGKDFAKQALELGVVVQPGEFYGLPAGRIVLSLITPEQMWKRGLQLLPFG
jgi:alanine-synthesizing transaminase